MRQIACRPSQIADDDTVIVRNPRFVEAVPALLDSTPKQVVYNYLFFRAASAGMTSLDKRAREISQEYSAAAQGTKAEKPLWKQCLQEVGYQTRGQVRKVFIFFLPSVWLFSSVQRCIVAFLHIYYKACKSN